MSIDLAAFRDRIEVMLMDTGNAIWDTGTIDEGLHQALDEYGIDRPDMRFDMLLKDISDIAKDSTFKVFSGTVERGGVVKFTSGLEA